MSSAFISLYLFFITLMPGLPEQVQTVPPTGYVTVVQAVYSQTAPTPSPVPTPTPTPPSSSTSTGPEKDESNKPSAEIDMSGIDYVEELKKLSFYRQETGDVDLDIRNAAVRFQAAHNLDVDGIWGDQSMGALRYRLGDKAFAYPDKVAKPASENKWITINKTRRILTLYQGKTVIKKYPIAVGNPSSLTPDGKHKIIVKIVNPAWGGGGYAKPVEGGSPYNPLGYRWLGLSLNGGGDYGIHGNNSPYSIGTNASHGCVRMINADVEELFEIIPINTPVWINTEEGLKEWGVEQPMYTGNTK